MVAGVHSIYRSADGCEPVARLSAAQAGEKPHRGFRHRTFPGAACCACPGYRSADGCEPVARSAQRHREENRSKASGSAPSPEAATRSASREENRSKAPGSAPSPEAARCACPGYRSADGCEPVARLSAAPPGRKPQQGIRQRTFPGGGALRLSGLPIRRRL